MPVGPVLRRLRKKDSDFKAHLGYIASSSLDYIASEFKVSLNYIHSETLSQKTNRAVTWLK
jgi:hypothetical protein